MVYFPGVEASENALRIVLADDHHFFREGLREMLAADGMTVVGEANDGARAVELARELAPDVVVIDLNMPNTSGIDAVRQIAAASPDVQLIVLTVSADEADVTRGARRRRVRLPAQGHAHRRARRRHPPGRRRPRRALTRRGASAGGTRARGQPTGRAGHERPDSALTARELEVIRLIVDGADNATIGRELSISRHTVKQYVTNIFEKLGVQSRVQAAVYAVRNGLV